MTVRHSVKALLLIASLMLATGCPEPPIEVDIEQPEVVVMANDVHLEGRAHGPAFEVITARYTVRTKEHDSTIVTRGALMLANDGRFATTITPDAPGLYTIEIEASTPGQPPTRVERDFRFSYPPPPTPRMIEPGLGDPIYGPSAPHTQTVRIRTRAGLRIEIMRGQVLLGRALATDENVELTISLEEGENPLRIIALDDRSSADQRVDLTLVVGEGPPPVIDPPADGDDVDRDDVDGDDANGDDINDTSGPPPPGPRPMPADDMGLQQPDRDAGPPSTEPDLGVDMALPPPVDMTIDQGAADAATPPAAERLDDACSRQDQAAILAIHQRGGSVAMTPTRSLCIARALRRAGDCSGASRNARSLLAQAGHRGAARLLLARCASRKAGSTAAAEHLAALVELHLGGDAGVTPEVLLSTIEKAKLSRDQLARVTAPCRRAVDDEVCASIAPTDVATLCAAGRPADAAEAHRRGSPLASRDRRCVAEGHLAAGRTADGLDLLDQVLTSTGSGQTAGEVGLLIAAHSMGARRDAALKRVVAALADTTYRAEDIAGVASAIRDAAPSDTQKQLVLVSACRDVADRAGCKALLDALGLSQPATGTVRVRFVRDGCRAAVGSRQESFAAGRGKTATAQVAPGRHTVRFDCPDALGYSNRTVEVGTGETVDIEQPPPPAEPNTGPPTDEVAKIVRHQIQLDPPSARFSLTIDRRPTPLDVRGGRVVVSPDEAGIGAQSYRLEAGGSTVIGMIDIERVTRKSLAAIKLRVPAKSAREPFSAGVSALSRGLWPDATRAFTRATEADPRLCIAWAYLGYAQAMSGAHAPASGSFQRCSGSLNNDTEGVVTARVLRAVTQLQKRHKGGSAKVLGPLVQRLDERTGSVSRLHRLLPETRNAPIKLRSLHRYWLAVGRARLYAALKDEGAPPDQVEDARAEALAAWEALPATRSGVGPGRMIQTRTSFADERKSMIRTLRAAGAKP